MYPTLIQISSFGISSFFVMVMVAFIVAYYLCEKDLIRRGEPGSIADVLLLASFVGGLVGAKLLFLYQNVTFSELLQDPLRYLPFGYTFFGGFIGALVMIYAASLYKRMNFWYLTDVSAAPVVIAYGIGRIGCLLVGDDYGVPTQLPWAMSFPDGDPPTLEKVHPTQIYDSVSMFILFYFLWNMRKKAYAAGFITSLTFIVLGAQRFCMEFIRNTTPSSIDGLSQAQLISLSLICAGIVKLLLISSGKSEKQAG